MLQKAISLFLFCLLASPVVVAETPLPTGNSAIFFHPDGTSASHWDAVRMLHYGPDGMLHWDRLPYLAPYRGHLSDRLVATSNAGAVIHATGALAYSDSFGLDPEGEVYTSADGTRLTIMQQALAAGLGTALVQTGSLIEPGTAAFVARASSRREYETIAEQVVRSDVDIILGAGEEWLLPKGTRGRFGEGSRTDGRNLIAELESAGYSVVYTRDELLALDDDVTRVFGVFALEDTYHDRSEEQLRDLGLDNYLASAPTVAEMTAFALERMRRHEPGFLMVIEEEGTDNLCNRQNANACLEAMKRADDAVGVIRDFIDEHPKTLMVMTSDSNANGPQVLHVPKELDEVPAADPWTRSAIDGVAGTETAPFIAAPDRHGRSHAFAIGWASGFDVGSGVLARGVGLNAERFLPVSGIRNTDIYRMLYATLFGEEIGYPEGSQTVE
ncbi:MAG: alkaline phosphatase [Wenzhouxiangella sp.]|jgi:alkaline phosphatase|nr:alkaline phosphatase [Wenzhouxiangella sp.]